MKNILISIGCDSYDDPALAVLRGAELDATRIASQLVELNHDYDAKSSIVLHSPTKDEVARYFSSITGATERFGVVTFFFACHGAMHSGRFYMCLKDTMMSSLPISALSMHSLCAFFKDVDADQINVVLDTCNAGAAMFDLPVILDEQLVGGLDRGNLSFLAASASRQNAEEDEDGGLLTSRMLDFVAGNQMIQTNRPYLDLIEIGRVISSDAIDLRRENDEAGEQIPVTWGLNLYGQGFFSKNHHYEEDIDRSRFPVGRVSPQSHLGNRIQQHSEKLWKEYRRIEKDFNAVRLLTRLQSVIESEELDGKELAKFVIGLENTLRAKAVRATDLMAEVDTIGILAIIMLPFLDNPECRELAHHLVDEWTQVSRGVAFELLSLVNDHEFALLHLTGALSDLFYLPMRVTAVLGWIGANMLFASEQSEGIEVYGRLSGAITNQYQASIVAVSDSQAPGLYVFSHACKRHDMNSLHTMVLERMAATHRAWSGAIAPCDINAENVLKFLLHRSRLVQDIEPSIVARPNHLHPVLFLCAPEVLLDEWDKYLIELDGHSINCYVPEDYASFSSRIMDKGDNYLFEIGDGNFFRAATFVESFSKTMQEHKQRSGWQKDSLLERLCIMASLILPDRVPYFLEFTLDNS